MSLMVMFGSLFAVSVFVFGHFCLHLHGLCIFRLAKCDAGLQVLKKSEQETCVAGTQVAIVNEILMDALICKYYFDVGCCSKCDERVMRQHNTARPLLSSQIPSLVRRRPFDRLEPPRPP